MAGESNPFGITGGLGGGPKDPTGWAATQKDTIDTTGLNIPNMTGMQTFAQLFQAIQADALHGSSGGKLWGTIRPILIAQSGNYTKKELATTGWIKKDSSGLQSFLTGLHNTNAVSKTAPLSAVTWITQKANDVSTTGKVTFKPNTVAKILGAKTGATTAQQIDDILNNIVIPSAKKLGSNATSAQLSAIAKKVYGDGTYAQPNIVDNAILGSTNVKKTIATDQSLTPLGGAIGSTANDARTIFHNYGIPVPKDPGQFADFIKYAVGPGGDLGKVTEYAKAQAVLLYPWMKTFLTGAEGSTGEGGTVAGYLQPFATNLAATLGRTPDSIDWTDPKWQSVVAKKGADGISVPQNLDQAIQTVKTDPYFGYDKTPQAKNEAYTSLSNIGQMFGFGQ